MGGGQEGGAGICMILSPLRSFDPKVGRGSGITRY